MKEISKFYLIFLKDNTQIVPVKIIVRKIIL